MREPLAYILLFMYALILISNQKVKVRVFFLGKAINFNFNTYEYHNYKRCQKTIHRSSG